MAPSALFANSNSICPIGLVRILFTVDCLIACNDCRIGAPVRCESVHLALNSGLERTKSTAEQSCSIGICDSRVDVGEEYWVVSVVIIHRSGSRLISAPLD